MEKAIHPGSALHSAVRQPRQLSARLLLSISLTGDVPTCTGHKPLHVEDPLGECTFGDSTPSQAYRFTFSFVVIFPGTT